jgi:hypothetical protein
MVFPAEELRVTVEMLIDGTWEDLTDAGDVLVRDGITITRGRGDEASRVSPSTCTFTLDNTGGKYSPRNPLSPYYGLLGRNMPVRVGVNRTVDAFDRTVANGLGTTSDGTATWSIDGTASAFAVSAGVGSIIAAVGTRSAIVGDYGDVDVTARIAADSIAGNPDWGIVTHWHQAAIDEGWFFALGTDELNISLWKANNSSEVGVSYDIPGGLAAGTWYRLRVQATSRYARARVWLDGDPEPAEWHVEKWDDDAFGNGFLPASGGVGFACRVGSGEVISFDEFQVDSWRFRGEVAELPPSWDVSGNDTTVRVTAAGFTRRWARTGQPPVQSAFRGQTLAAENKEVTVAYWPCEDFGDAREVAAGLPGVQPMRILGDRNFAADSESFTGSDALLTLATGTALNARIPNHTGNGVIAYRGAYAFPSGGLADNTTILDLWQAVTAVRRWRLSYRTASGGSLQLSAIGAGGTVIDQTSVITFAVNGRALMIGFTVVQDGSGVDWHVFGRYVAEDRVFELGLDGTFASMTVDRAAELYVAPDGNMGDVTTGHHLVGISADLAENVRDAMTGYRGEAAANRVARLADEGGIRSIIYGNADVLADVAPESTPCGPQQVAARSELLYNAVDADGGILFEPRAEFGIAFRSRASMDNQRAKATLSYPGGEVTPPLQPVPDDQHTVNDVNATRYGGASYRAVVESGPMNVNEPEDDPQGVGRYEQEPTAHVATDDLLPDFAHWATRVGTVDEDRYPVITVSHNRLGLDGKTSLSAAVAALDIGDRLVITDPPESVPPEAINQIVQGYTEQLLPFQWAQAFNCTPAAAYSVGEVYNEDATHGFDPRVAGDDDMVLTSAVSSSATRLLSQSVSGTQVWCTATDDAESADDFPFDIAVVGERITVTAVDRSLVDTMTRTVGAGGWGTASDGLHAYAVGNGTASNFSVNGSEGLVDLSTVNAEQHISTDIGASFNQNVRLWCTLPVTPTGAGINWGILLRYTDASNYYWADVQVGTDSSLTLRFIKRVAGVATQIATAVSPVTHSTSVARALRAQIVGSAFRSRVWPATSPEPQYWQLVAEDSAISGTTLTRAGAICRLMTGNTNPTPVQFRFDNIVADSPQALTVVRGVNGITKSLPAGAVMEVFEPAYVAR